MILPLAGYVLIAPSKPETKTAAGIILPENSQPKPDQGKVLALGADTKDLSCPVQLNDMVAYKRYSGNLIKEGTTEYQLVKFEDLIAIIK